jgi:hypothetical protein
MPSSAAHTTRNASRPGRHDPRRLPKGVASKKDQNSPQRHDLCRLRPVAPDHAVVTKRASHPPCAHAQVAFSTAQAGRADFFARRFASASAGNALSIVMIAQDAECQSAAAVADRTSRCSIGGMPGLVAKRQEGLAVGGDKLRPGIALVSLKPAACLVHFRVRLSPQALFCLQTLDLCNPCFGLLLVNGVFCSLVGRGQCRLDGSGATLKLRSCKGGA